jgi:UDP-N-acetylmuramoyl-L-alanyl-D-glutamate--2,6-diaminopimelate ligase
VPDARRAAAIIAAAFYGFPAQQLNVVGITGTNGKTTTAFLLEHLVAASGLRPGLIGTVWYKFAGEMRPASHTTPDAVTLQRLFAEMLAQGQTHVIMEVSSHALAQDRVWGIPFRTAVFTNLTQDHLDYHGDLERYFESKARLFRGLNDDQWAVLNADDPAARRVAALTRGRTLWYGIEARDAQVRARQVHTDRSGIRCHILTPEGTIEVASRLIGRHNIYNLLAACAAAVTLKLPPAGVTAAIATFTAVPGRLERIESSAPFDVFVDYAHTEDALQNVLTALRGLAPRRLLVVFGCGGDRDRGKRP